MKTLRLYASLLCLAGVAALSGCSSAPKAPDVAANVRTALSQAGLPDITTTQDRDKGVVTLTGHVPSDNDKIRAESIARSVAGQQVVANQIEVLPPGVEADAKKVNAALDKGVAANMDAALIQYNLRDVKYTVKNHVVTLTGDVDSQEIRTKAETVAAAVPNVQQVVNELQVRVQKATSTR
jgi:hyperosmotically inducible periplasmic protein